MPTPPQAPLKSPFFQTISDLSQQWQMYFTQLGNFMKSLGTAAFQNSGAFLQPANNLSDVSNGQLALGSLTGAWASWKPVLSASGSMTVSSLSIQDAQFLNLGKVTLFRLWLQFSLGGSASTIVYASLPFPNIGQAQAVCGNALQNGALWMPGYFTVAANSNLLLAQLSGQGNWPLGATQIIASGLYRNV